jgi:hypothetical protein
MTAATLHPVLPPAEAVSANDLWDITLPAEIEALNVTTHAWFYDEDGGRCGSCDCRSGGAWSRFACRHGHGAVDAVTFEAFTSA